MAAGEDGAAIYVAVGIAVLDGIAGQRMPSGRQHWASASRGPDHPAAAGLPAHVDATLASHLCDLVELTPAPHDGAKVVAKRTLARRTSCDACGLPSSCGEADPSKPLGPASFPTVPLADVWPVVDCTSMPAYTRRWRWTPPRPQRPEPPTWLMAPVPLEDRGVVCPRDVTTRACDTCCAGHRGHREIVSLSTRRCMRLTVMGSRVCSSGSSAFRTLVVARRAITSCGCRSQVAQRFTYHPDRDSESTVGTRPRPGREPGLRIRQRASMPRDSPSASSPDHDGRTSLKEQ